MAKVLDFRRPHVLRNEAEYAAAVAEIDHLLDADPEPESEGHERLEFLSVLVQAYEDRHFPLHELTTPQDVVGFMLEQKGLAPAALAEWLGGESQTSEFLNGNRRLSIQQIEILRDNLGIPADLLISPSKTAVGA